MKLSVRWGDGFFYEIVDDDAPGSVPVATTSPGQVDGLDLAKLFAAAPAMHQALKKIKDALACGRASSWTIVGACQLAEEIANEALGVIE